MEDLKFFAERLYNCGRIHSHFLMTAREVAKKLDGVAALAIPPPLAVKLSPLGFEWRREQRKLL